MIVLSNCQGVNGWPLKSINTSLIISQAASEIIKPITAAFIMSLPFVTWEALSRASIIVKPPQIVKTTTNGTATLYSAKLIMFSTSFARSQKLQLDFVVPGPQGTMPSAKELKGSKREKLRIRNKIIKNFGRNFEKYFTINYLHCFQLVLARVQKKVCLTKQILSYQRIFD